MKRESGNVPECFRCHGYGHKSYECRVRQDDRYSRVVCFTCNQSGHKSPECPNKLENNTQNAHSKSSDSTHRNLGNRSGSKPKHTNWLAVGSNFTLIEGKVNGFKCEIAPDTGTEITVVPGNLVYESQLLPETVEVRGATGVSVHLFMAEVEFEIEGESLMRKVAVAHAGMLCDKVLFSVPMDGSMARKLLVDAVRASDVKEAKIAVSEDTPEVQTPAEANVLTRAGAWQQSLASEVERVKEQDTVPPVPLIEPLVISSEVANESEAVTYAGDAGREGEVADVDEEVAGNDVSEQVDSAVACENLSLGCPAWWICPTLIS